MDRTLQVLLLARDHSLNAEVENALEELPDNIRVALHTESDHRRGVEHAVNRKVDAVFLELGDDTREALHATKEIGRGTSVPLVFMIYRPRALGGEAHSETLLIDMMRAGARDFLRRPVSARELEDLLRRHFMRMERDRAHRGRVISFLGNKGGVGKSTVSLSVACGLAREHPDSVLLIDASLQHGAMCELLGLTPETTITDAARQIDRLDERLLRMFSTAHPSGLRVLAAPPNAIDAAPVTDEAFARILSVARHAFDYVVVDTFPLIDSVTVAILDVADLVFVVLNDFVPAVLGTAELLNVIQRLGVPEDRLRIILNHSSGAYRGRLREVDVARRLSHDLDFIVPYSKRVLAATNTGEPYALRAPRRWGFGRAMRRIEREVLDWNPEAQGSQVIPLPPENEDLSTVREESSLLQEAPVLRTEEAENGAARHG